MAKKDGTLIGLQIGGNLLLGTTNHSLSQTSDMIDCTTKDSGGDKEYLPGERDATITVDGLYDPASTNEGYSDVFGNLQSGAKIVCIFGLQETSDPAYQFEGYISQLDLTGPKNEAASYSLTIQRTGGTTAVTIS